VQPVERLVIACELLEEALRFYYGGTAHYACLHLAGAAEDIFGAYVEKHGGESAFKNHRRAGARLSAYFNEGGTPSSEKDIGDVINFAKNRTKHGHGLVEFDPKSEARHLLDRALTNYYQLMQVYPLPETDLVRRFNNDLSPA
jgi:hypothetical protein